MIHYYVTDFVITDGKTKVSMIVLPYLLVPPPQRGVKKPRLSRKLAAGLLLADTKVIS